MRIYRYDLHTHPRPTRNGPAAVQKYVDAAAKAGLDGIAITEHAHTEGLYTLPRDLELPDGFTLLQGQEVTTSDLGHVLVFGYDRTLKRRPMSATIGGEMVLRIKAHPLRDKLPAGGVDPRFGLQLDATEVHNGGYKPDRHAESERVWTVARFTGTGGSDAHRARHVGKCWTCFPYPIRNEHELVQAIKGGHCWPGRKGNE